MSVIVHRGSGGAGGGGGAPTNASYVVIGLDGTLSAERQITPGASIAFDDAGANSTLTVRVKDIGARVYNSVSEVIPDATETDLTFDTERYDVGGVHSAVGGETHKLTAPVTGKYIITGHVEWLAGGTGIRQNGIFLNNTNYLAVDTRKAVDDSTGILLCVATVTELAAGDYVTLRVFANQGTPMTVYADPNFSPEFAMQLICET